MGLVGESGSGKTTVALALLGHARRGLELAAGRVMVGGTDMVTASEPQLRRMRGAEVAYVPQDPASALNPVLRIGTQLVEVLHAHPDAVAAKGLGDPRTRVAETLNEAGLGGVPGLLKTYPHQLSGGQQQRVALAMAFALRPSVIVLDEPTTGLDVTTQRLVLDTVRSLCQAYGVAAVFVSHDLAVVGGLVNRLTVMYAGKVMESGRTAVVFGAPAHPYTMKLLRAVPSPERSEALEGIDGQPPHPARRPPRVRVRSSLPAHVGYLHPGPGPVRLPGRGAPRALPADGPHSPPRGQPGRRALGCKGAEHNGQRPTPCVQSVGPLRHRRGALRRRVERGPQRVPRRGGRVRFGQDHPGPLLGRTPQRMVGRGPVRGEVLPKAAYRRSRQDLQAIQFIFQNPYASLNPRYDHRSDDRTATAPFLPVPGPLRAGRAGVARFGRRLPGAGLLVPLPGPALRGRTPAGGHRPGPRGLPRTSCLRRDHVRLWTCLCRRRLSSYCGACRLSGSLSLLFITHNLALVRSIAQSVLVLSKGRVVESGPVARVFERPEDPYTVRLMEDVPRLPRGEPDARLLAT